jgi:hypothetical protein
MVLAKIWLSRRPGYVDNRVQFGRTLESDKHSRSQISIWLTCAELP